MTAKRAPRAPAGLAQPVSQKGDLVVLCADKNWQAVLQEMLARPQALGIRQLRDHEVRLCPLGHDSGVRAHGPEILATQVARFAHGMLVLDYDGSHALSTAADLQAELTNRLAQAWQDRATALVVEPELETWIVGAWKHFGDVVQSPGLDARAWWQAAGYWAEGNAKPLDPKAAVEALLGAHRQIRSGPNYRILAAKASLRPDHCVTSSFKHFVATLQTWFPLEPSPHPNKSR